MSNDRRSYGFGCLAISLVASFVYWPQLGFYFTDVDTFALITTSRFATFEEFLHVLSSPMMGGQLTNALFYRPLASMTWSLDHWIWGANPFGYHLTDLLLHVAASLAFLTVMWSVAGDDDSESDAQAVRSGRIEALLAALLFAIHPVAMETVPAIARRPDLLFGLFLLLSLVCLSRYVRAPSGRSLAGASLFCVLGVASKDSAIATCGIALVFVFCFSRAPNLRARVLECFRVAVPIWVAAASYIALRVWVIGGIGGYAGSVEYSYASVFKTSVGTFICSMAAPGNLDQCTPNALPWLGIMLVLAAGASLWRVGSEWQSPSTRRAAFGALSILAFLTLFLLVRTPALTRTIYALLPFSCIVVAWGVVGGLQLIGSRRSKRADDGGAESSKNSRLVLSSVLSRATSGTIFAVIAASIVYGGATRIYLDEWRALGATVERLLSMASPHVETLAPGSVVYLIGFPDKVNDPRPVLRDHPLFQDHTVQGWSELVLPEKKLDIIGLSSMILEGKSLHEISYRVHFEQDRSRIQVSLGPGGSAAVFPTDRPYGKRHPLREVSSTEDDTGHHLVFDLTPDAFSADEVVFLVYLGDRFALRGADVSWVVENAKPKPIDVSATAG